MHAEGMEVGYSVLATAGCCQGKTFPLYSLCDVDDVEQGEVKATMVVLAVHV